MPLEQSKKPALFTDIDDTLIARDSTDALVKAVRDLQTVLAAAKTTLVLVTGAEFTAVKKRIEAGEIPPVDAVICAVGTDIWLRTRSGWEQDAAYATLLDKSGYNKSDVTLQAARFIRESPAGYELTFQPDPVGPKKVSLHFMASHPGATMLAGKARDFFAPFKVITCEEIHHNGTLPVDALKRKFCMDIVPATKADAVSYLVGRLGITDGFKAGDSGNDIAMLLNPDNLVPILVGGYKPEAYAAISAELTGEADGSLHTLKDGRKIYIESDPTRTAAASLLHAINTLQ